ncbi:HK97 family phage prohead protease [Kitasatospora sp. NBC_01266]|uniref:HK97 family phage prohead protease n=1 Tax=Kitasatospora sp. NBC_01266 TaxID=2903572 RepID=UPI002E2EC297|nr:HK97 family phage prohead protease [Kitasatospora sp. NBC_01266]
MDLSARSTQPTELQRRTRPFTDVQLRSAPDGTGGDQLVFSGYASVTETPYAMEDWAGPYTEVVRSGAFRQTLAAGADVPFLINHGGLTLARTASGTMQLAEDSTGLHVEAALDPASSLVQDLRSAMNRGDVDQMSFGFWVTRQAWSPDFDQRDILEVDLDRGDVSVVNFGANPNTAGAQMQLNARDVSGQLQRLSTAERRAVFERLAAEFNAPPAPEAAALALHEARARALAL